MGRKKRKAYVFVAVLPASNYTFVGVYRTMKMPDWLAANSDSLDYFGGIPELLIPDNAKTAVSKACLYDPELNRSFQQFSAYYNLPVLPARSIKPRDKAKVETAVQIAERWILARLRNLKFLNFSDLQAAIAEQLEHLNTKSFSKLDGNRRSLFLAEEKQTLAALPRDRFNLGLWKHATVANDYHIAYANHFYSVPHRFINSRVDLHVCSSTIEIYHDNRRIASHIISDKKGKATTLAEHRPEAHNAVIHFNVDSYHERAGKVSEHFAAAIAMVIDAFPRPEMAFRGVNGLFRLLKDYEKERMDKACQLAVENQLCSYRHIKNILDNKKDHQIPSPDPISITHKNIRGADNFTKGNA